MFAVRSIGLLLCSGEERLATIQIRGVSSKVSPPGRGNGGKRVPDRLSQFYSVFARCVSAVRGTFGRDRRNAPTSCAPVRIDFTQLREVDNSSTRIRAFNWFRGFTLSRTLRSRVRRYTHARTHAFQTYLNVRGRSVKASRKRTKKTR